jgi:ribosomal protein L16 Arg81 hydroxylase
MSITFSSLIEVRFHLVLLHFQSISSTPVWLSFEYDVCYNKANWNTMKNDITSILDQLLQMFRDPDCNVNTMREFFKQTLSKSAKQHIPQTNSKDKDRQPWINRNIKKNLKKNYTDYTKRRRNLVTIKLKNSITISNIILKR